MTAAKPEFGFLDKDAEHRSSIDADDLEDELKINEFLDYEEEDGGDARKGINEIGRHTEGKKSDLKTIVFYRILFTSTSTVAVNSTLIRVVSAIIGALLLALPLFLAVSTAGGGGGGGGGGGYGYSRRGKRDNRDKGKRMV